MCRPPCRALVSFLSASARAEAASSVERTTTRSAMRRSIASTSFSRIFCSRSSFTSRASASAAPQLRQAHVHAVVHLERPAPPGDERAGADAVLERACGLEQREVILVARDWRRSPTTKRQVEKRSSCIRSITVPSAAMMKSSPLCCQMACGSRSVSVDDELVRIELAHDALLDQRNALEALAHARSRRGRRARRLPIEAGGRQNLVLAHLRRCRRSSPARGRGRQRGPAHGAARRASRMKSSRWPPCQRPTVDDGGEEAEGRGRCRGSAGGAARAERRRSAGARRGRSRTAS